MEQSRSTKVAPQADNLSLIFKDRFFDFGKTPGQRTLQLFHKTAEKRFCEVIPMPKTN